MGGTWFGLIDGDRYKDGMRHFFQHEAAFVRFKHRLLKYDVLQLLLVCFTYVLLRTSGRVLSWLGHLAWVRALSKGQSGAPTRWLSLCAPACARDVDGRRAARGKGALCRGKQGHAEGAACRGAFSLMRGVTVGRECVCVCVQAWAACGP